MNYASSRPSLSLFRGKWRLSVHFATLASLRMMTRKRLRRAAALVMKDGRCEPGHAHLRRAESERRRRQRGRRMLVAALIAGSSVMMALAFARGRMKCA